MKKYAIYNKRNERMYQYPATQYIEKAVSRYLLLAKDIYPEAGMHIVEIEED